MNFAQMLTGYKVPETLLKPTANAHYVEKDPHANKPEVQNLLSQLQAVRKASPKKPK